MDKEDTSSGSDLSGGSGLPDPDFLDILQTIDDLRKIEPHHNCFTKELLSHRNPGEGTIIFYLTDIDGNIQASITFKNREENWNGESMYYQAEIDFSSELFASAFSNEDIKDLEDLFSDLFVVVMPEPDFSLHLRIPSEKSLRTVDGYPNNQEQRQAGITSTLSKVQMIADYFQSLENSQYHIENLKQRAKI
jgi:hypothetical protein